MARIAGVDLPREKRVEIGLTYVFGIGRKTSNEILAKTGINPDTRVKDLTEEEAAKLREVIERDYNVEGDLRREIGLNIKRLVEIGCYRGLRHRRGLRAGADGIGEDVHGGEGAPAYKVQGLVELLLRLAGEAHNEIGGDTGSIKVFPE